MVARSSTPHVVGDLDDEAELGHLVVVGELIALDGGRESALRRQAQLIERHIARRLVDPSPELILALELRTLGSDQSQNDLFALGHEPQRFEAAGTGVVVFEEEPVDLKLVEEGFGHVVVAALGGPRGAEVASAQVGGDRHGGWPGRQGGVDLADVAEVLAAGVVAPPGQHGALNRIIQIGQAGVVELEVGAAELREGGDLGGVGGAQVVPELVDVRVDRWVERGGSAPVVDHARGRNGQLRRQAGGVVAEEAEVVGEDGLWQGDAIVDGESGRLEGQPAFGVEELHLELLVGRTDPAEAVDEVHVP